MQLHNLTTNEGEYHDDTLSLNQALTGRRPACTWFLKIVSVQMSVCVCLCMYLPLRLLITSGVMWHAMDPIQLVKQVLQLSYGNCSYYRKWAWPWN